MSVFIRVLAHLLSGVLHPGLLAAVVFGMYTGWVPEGEQAWVWGIMLSCLLVPAFLMWYEVRKAGDQDYALRSRRKRQMPLAIQSGMLLAACAVILGHLHLSFEAQRFVVLLTILVVVLWLITYRWKISLHTAGCTFLVLHVWIEPPFPYGAPVIMLLASIPLLAAWARWFLGVHTYEQLIAGFGLGMGTSLGVAFVT